MVLLGDVTVAKGLWYLAQQNVDVVSMSLGGYPAQFLESVVLHAVFERDMIVCAAAGNYWPVVVAPAAYESCIGVAATTPTDRPWLYSASGPAVDISAPGHLVWCADFDARTRNPSPHAGSGTSFAVPHVAGAAALWLAHHGKVTVQREAGGRPLQFVFKSLLQQTARVPGRFDSNVGFDDLQLAPGSLLGDSWPIDQRGLTRFGPGILDVDRFLAAPLRDASSSASTSDPATGLTSWVKIVEGILCAYPVWREALEVLFGQSGDDLDGLIEGYGAELSKLFMDATSSNAADPVRVFLTAVADWVDAVATQEALALDPSAPPAVAAAVAQAAAAAWAAVEAAAAAAAQALAAAASAALKALFPWL